MKIKRDKNITREAPPKFIGRFGADGGLDFGEYTKANLKDFIRKNPGMPFQLLPLTPESKDQRSFFEGAVVPLVTFYQEGLDHHNTKDRDKVREWLKIEMNGEIVIIGNKAHKVGQSTKNKLNRGFLERCIGYLEENYAPPPEALDPKKYQDWHDRIFPSGKGPDNYIDYLVELNILRKVNQTITYAEKTR